MKSLLKKPTPKKSGMPRWWINLFKIASLMMIIWSFYIVIFYEEQLIQVPILEQYFFGIIFYLMTFGIVLLGGYVKWVEEC